MNSLVKRSRSSVELFGMWKCSTISFDARTLKRMSLSSCAGFLAINSTESAKSFTKLRKDEANILLAADCDLREVFLSSGEL